MAPSKQPRRLLVTSALPYANGSIHLGHLVEYIQTDIWVRFQKLCGHECHYVCADDTHGTAIMLSAKKQGLSPEDLIRSVQKEHEFDFNSFHIDFDMYYSTHSDENKRLSEFFYSKATEKDAITTKDVDQFYDAQENIFLADRYIKGTCPFCKADNQYGDSCEKCYATYTPDQLLNPKSTISETTPIKKSSTHYFFKLHKFESLIKDWLDQDTVNKEVRNKLDEWLTIGLNDWDISRDAPYFGFKIPHTHDKYFYVWLDAPIGYLASTQHMCENSSSAHLDFDSIWKSGDYEIHHFIGKDILYFHTLFWPAMLDAAEFQKPTKVHVHGFLTVNGEKMSKSRGTFILAKDYAKTLEPDFLRYYYAAKLSGSMDDIDFNMEDFVFKVNSDVVGKVINIGSRLGSIITKKLGGRLSAPDTDGHTLLTRILDAQHEIYDFYEHLAYHKAMMTIMRLADDVNKYINDKAPWALTNDHPDDALAICTTGLNALRLFSIYLKPVLPSICSGIDSFLNCSNLNWSDLDSLLTHHPINPYTHLAQRLDLPTVKNSLRST